MPCVALVWIGFLSGHGYHRSAAPTQASTPDALVEVSLLELPDAVVGLDADRVTRLGAELSPVAAGTNRDRISELRRHPGSDRRSAERDRSPAPPLGGHPAGRACVVPAAAPTAGGDHFSTRTSASAGSDDSVLALGDPTVGADLRCRHRTLISRPTPPVEYDCLRLCGRGPPSPDQVA
jgi:hypothetical protein